MAEVMQVGPYSQVEVSGRKYLARMVIKDPAELGRILTAYRSALRAHDLNEEDPAFAAMRKGWVEKHISVEVLEATGPLKATIGDPVPAGSLSNDRCQVYMPALGRACLMYKDDAVHFPAHSKYHPFLDPSTRCVSRIDIDGDEEIPCNLRADEHNRIVSHVFMPPIGKPPKKDTEDCKFTYPNGEQCIQPKEYHPVHYHSGLEKYSHDFVAD